MTATANWRSWAMTMITRSAASEVMRANRWVEARASVAREAFKLRAEWVERSFALIGSGRCNTLY